MIQEKSRQGAILSGFDGNAKGSERPRHLRARLLIEGGYECDYTSHDQKISSGKHCLSHPRPEALPWDILYAAI